MLSLSFENVVISIFMFSRNSPISVSVFFVTKEMFERDLKFPGSGTFCFVF